MNFLDSEIISKISHIHSICQDFLRDELNKKGLPNLASSHGHILFLLSRNSNLTMQELAKKINRDKSTTTVLVRKLEKLNLVKSIICPKDNRSKLIELTPEGKSYTEQTHEISNNLKKTFFKNFSLEENNQLEKIITKIENNFNLQ